MTALRPDPSRLASLSWHGLVLLVATLYLMFKLGTLHSRPAPSPAAAASRPGDVLPVPWEPLLTREELRRGLTYYGSGGGLSRVAAKLLAGQPLRVYFLGASVTLGGGSTDAHHAYTQLFARAINTSFPHRDHRFIVNAAAARTSYLAALCLHDNVTDADLVTLEFTVNDSRESPLESQDRQGWEVLLRRLLRRPDPPALLIVHTYAWQRSTLPVGPRTGIFYVEPEGQMTQFANYYDTPSVSLRSATWRLMHAGIHKFRVDKVLRAGMRVMYKAENGSDATLPSVQAAANETDAFFYSDPRHPSNWGHQAMAELMAEPLRRSLLELQSGQALTAADRRDSPLLAGLPPPMLADSRGELPGMCAIGAGFEAAVTAQQGFAYVAERPEQPSRGTQLWGWRGTQPGSWAELALDTSFGGNGGETHVWLTFLRNTAGMGAAAVECVAGCSCEPRLLDCTWRDPKRENKAFGAMLRFEVSRHARCRVRVTISDQPGKYTQDGHQVTLIAVFVTHVPLATAGTLAMMAG